MLNQAFLSSFRVLKRTHKISLNGFRRLNSSDANQLPPDLLHSRTCVVTNCDFNRSEYLPNQIAHSLARHGASVIVQGSEDGKLDSLIEELPAEKEQKHAFLASPPNVLDDPIGLADSIGKDLSNLTDKIDVLISNAGLVGVPPVGLDRYPVEEFDRVVRFNLTAPVALVKKTLPLLEKGHAPNIILTSTEVEYPKTSEDGTVQVGGAYYISQFGFRSSGMLAKLLARELYSRKISVNTIDPGRVFLFKTPIEIPDDSDRTIPYIWLSRPDTILTAEQIDVKDWLRRDPAMFTQGY